MKLCKSKMISRRGNDERSAEKSLRGESMFVARPNFPYRLILRISFFRSRSAIFQLAHRSRSRRLPFKRRGFPRGTIDAIGRATHSQRYRAFYGRANTSRGSWRKITTPAHEYRAPISAEETKYAAAGQFRLFRAARPSLVKSE